MSRPVLSLFLACAASQLNLIAAPSVGRQFLVGQYLSPGEVKPDCHVAVGHAHVAALLNTGFTVLDKDRGNVLRSELLWTFWTAAGIPANSLSIPIFDNRILFDVAADRWYAMSLTKTGFILFGVSNTGDPSGTWSGTALAVEDLGKCWPDFPEIGMDSEAVYVAPHSLQATVFPDDAQYCSSLNRVFFTIPKADIHLPIPTFANVRRVYAGQHGSWPVVVLDNSPPPSVLWKRAGNPQHPCVFGYTLLSDPAGTPSFGDDFLVPLDGWSNSCGISADILVRDGVIWGVGTYATLTSLQQDIQFFRISIGSNVTIEDQAFHADWAGHPLIVNYPSVGVNNSGDVVIGCDGYTRNTQGQVLFSGSFAFVGQVGGGTTLFGPPILLNEGLISSLDYTATVVDPDDPKRFWTIQGFVANPDILTVRTSEIVLDGARPRVGSVVSRKLHLGVPYDIDQSSSGATECRDGGITQLVVTFDADVQIADGSLDIGDEALVSQGSMTGLSLVGRQLVVDLSDVPDGTTTLTLNGFASVLDLTVQLTDKQIPLRARVGDANNNDAVTNCDAVAVNTHLGQASTPPAFRYDIDASGLIDAADLAIIEAHATDTCEACDIASDCNQNGRLDTCEGDVDGNGVPDVCESRVLAWRSVHIHAGVGDVGIPLDASAAGFFATTEPRIGGVSRVAIEFTIPSNFIDFPGVRGSDGSQVTYPDLDLYSISADLKTWEFQFLSPLADGVCYTFDLANVVTAATANGLPLVGDADCTVRSFEGDVDSDGWVLQQDVTLVQSNDGQPVSSSTARFDLDLDGDIDAADELIAHDRIGLSSSTCAPSIVVGRHIFYNNSFYDTPSTGSSGCNHLFNGDSPCNDNSAVPSRIIALLPGQVPLIPTPGNNFTANYSSYTSGINGVVVDVQHPAGAASLAAGTLSPEQIAATLEFVETTGTGTGRAVDSLYAGAFRLPTSVTVAPHPTAPDTDRLTIVFADNTSTNSSWLRVRVLTGGAISNLAGEDRFYFGLAMAEGLSAVDANALVDIQDQNDPKSPNNHTTFNRASVDDEYDYNRDSLVDINDQGFPKAPNMTTTFNCLLLTGTAP